MKLKRTRLRTRSTKRLLAEALKENPELLDGVMVIAFRIDGSLVASHNYCCLGHAMNRAAMVLNRNPEYTEPHKGQIKADPS